MKPKYSKIKAFKIKLLLEKLPTNEVKYNRDKNKKITPYCPRGCTQTESNYHLLTCSHNPIFLRKIVKDAISHTLKKSGIEFEVVLNNIQKTITNSICITDRKKK